MAAAFAALVSLQNNLDLLQNHPRHSFSFDDKQIESLRGSVSFLIDFMKSYDDSHGARKEAAEALERRIARAAEAAEDVVESHVVDQIRDGTSSISKTRSSRFLLDLQRVIESMDYMKRKAMNVKARSGVVEAEVKQPTYSAVATSSNSLTSSEKNSTVGFDGVLLQLLDLLTGVPSSRRVIPIVGMGGIGKTTLATDAFQHSVTVYRFDICLWVTISQQYSVEKILTQLLSQLRNFTTKIVDETTNKTVDGLGQQLYKNLCGQRYLIVLDDMWGLKAWDDINCFFPKIGNGSRIVVTTRHSDVANHLGFPSVAMSFLDEGSSWDLFCQKAFAGQGCPPELAEIGKKIVEKCKGLPLAIVVVGGHLRKSSMALEYWENVASHMNSILDSAESDGQCLNVLSLSYSYLPAHLKPCFLLLGAFPEDAEIYGRDVFKLWIAEGLVQPIEDTRLEVVAHDYLWDLYERNLISVDSLAVTGEFVYLKLHDLLRELCIKIAKEEGFFNVLDTPRAIKRERRVAISGEVREQIHQTKTFDAPLRCLMICEGRWPSSDMRMLRTLNKVVAASTNLSIFQQVNLRLLELQLGYTTLRTLYLPSSVSLLWNLQTLSIHVSPQSIVIAPYEIWEMLQLRNLEVNPICLLDPLPVDRSDDKRDDLVLRNLRTLWKVKNFRLSEEVYKRIPNIEELHLSYRDEASSDYCPHNLCYFRKLGFMICDFEANSKWHDFAMCLTFPSSLKILYLGGCGVDWEEMTTMVGSLPHLTCLQLWPHSVIGSVWNHVEGKFLGLKYLEICDCHDLVYWNADSSHFPVLQELILIGLSKLEEFPSDIGEISTLRYIELEFCSESSTISAMRTLVQQEEQGNESLRLRVSFRGDEETLESFNSKVEEEGLTSNNLSLHLEIVKPKSM